MNGHLLNMVLVREEFGCAYRRGSYFYRSISR